MMRDDQVICGEVKTLIAFVVGGVAKQDTPVGPKGELMWCGGDSVRVTCAAEDAEVLVRGCRLEESDMRADNTGHLCGETFSGYTVV
jgi:hypothetical protein